MKKFERLNVIMRYINNRSRFTIAEIMQEFNISRSTAIRDIREIEAMGMPLVAEVGRNGGYDVMNNATLPSVRFTDNEVKALFIAFMATRNRQLPYLRSRQSLAEKLLGLISENQQNDIIFLNKILLFEGTNPHNPDLLELTDLPHPILEKLIRALLEDRFLLITVKEEHSVRSRQICLLHLYNEKSNWLLDGYDLQEDRKRIFSVDEIIDVKTGLPEKRIGMKKVSEKLGGQKRKINLCLALGPAAVAQFKKYHPFGMSISFTDPFQSTAVLKDFIDIQDAEKLDDLINWLLFLGRDLKIREAPDEVLERIQERLTSYFPT